MASTAIEVNELPGRWQEVISLTEAGQEVIVTEQNVPKARLVPLAPRAPRIPGLHAGAITTTDDFDDPLPDSYWTQSP